MAVSDFVTAVHSETKLVSSIPRSYLDLYPHFTELSDEDVAKVRREAEVRIFGRPFGEAPAQEVASPNAAWRKDDLLAYAETHGVEHDPTANKAEILDAITAQEGTD